MILRIIFLATVLSGAAGLDNFYFSSSPADLDVVEGRETKLLCDVSDRKHIVFQWRHAGKEVENTTRRFQEDSNLRILRVTREEDLGPFQCIATNVTTGFSLQSGEANLNIQWIEERAEVTLKKTKLEEVVPGANITLKCQISGNPEPSILWYHNKFRLFTSEYVKVTDEGWRIKLLNLSANLNGIYSCRAENVAGAVDSNVNFLLNVDGDAKSPKLIQDKFTAVQLVLKNDPARLDCPFQNAKSIEWFSNYEKLSNNSRYTVFGNGSLYFPKVRSTDEGSYRCVALSYSEDTDDSQTFTSELILADLDEILPETFEPRLQPNYPIVIPLHETFEVKFFPPKGKPTPTFRWLDRYGLVIGDTGRIRLQENRLIFENPQEVDSGNYTFIVNNTVGERRQSVWIVVSVPPAISRAPQQKEVEEGGSVQLGCQVMGTPYPVTTITWLKDNQYIKQGWPRHRMNMVDGTLVITPIELDDVGMYACVANTSGHPIKVSSMASLIVIKRLKFSPIPQNAFLELNQRAQVECHAEAQTKPQIHWIKRDSKDGLPPHVREELGVLKFDIVKRTDAGYYTCVAAHHVQGTINTTIYIKIVEKPKFSYKPDNMTVLEGQSAMIHCVATGDPKPSVQWDKENNTITSVLNRRVVFANGTLLLKRVFIEDSGRYGCTANNTAGIVHTTMMLRVASPEDRESFNMMKTIIIAVCSAGAYLALVIGLTAFCSYRRLMNKRSRKGLSKPQLETSQSFVVKAENGDLHREQHELLMKDRDSGTQFRSDSDNRSHASGLSSQPSQSSQSQQSRSPRPDSQERLFFPRQDLLTLGMIGKGHFGDVFLAKARGIRAGELETLVVVKSLLTKGDRALADFRREVEMYIKLDHPNVVKLLGLCREMEPQFMITEYCDWGDLKQFLLATRSDNGRRMTRVPPLTAGQKARMCQQVALGMEHVAAHRFVHRDLATRNVLLTSRLDLKVSSLALSRDVYAGEYYPHGQTLVPLRWLAPEALVEEDYSPKSDVWAFGVFVWEVFHLADLPYRLLSDDEVLKGLRAGQLLLDHSDHCPQQVATIVRRCMADLPRDRPGFGELSVMLEDLMADLEM